MVTYAYLSKCLLFQEVQTGEHHEWAEGDTESDPEYESDN